MLICLLCGLAIVARGGALNKQSLYEAWVTYDGGSLRDDRIADSCTRDNFAQLWAVLTFVDYSQLTYNEAGFVVTDDPIVRVRKVLDMIEHKERTRSGYSTARRWAIMPPMDTPTICAESIPRESSTPAASSAMSHSL